MSYNKKEIKTKSTAKTGKSNPFKEDVITDPMGQWKHPGEVTRIPSGNITMKGVPYPVLGVDNLGNKQMMQPGMDYTFPGESVTEYPQMQKGGPSPDKALAMLRDGMAHGHPLTEKQIEFFKSLLPEEDEGEVEEFRKGGQGRMLKRNKTSKNLKTSLNYIMAQNYELFGPTGRRFYDPNSKFEMGGPLEDLITYMQTGGSFVAPPTATKVSNPEQGYKPIPGQDPNAMKLYFDKQIKDAQSKNTGIMSPDQKKVYEEFLIKQAQNGVNPEELIKKGYASPSMLPTLKQYYKPVYVEKEAAKTNSAKIPMDVENTINRKEIFPTGQQSFRTFQYPDVNAGYANSTMRYFDSTGNKEIDVNKSFDDKGQFKPFYIEGTPGAEGTLKQTRGTVTDPNNLQQSKVNPTINTLSTGFQMGGVNVIDPYLPDYFNSEFLMKDGGLSRGQDYGSEKKPYPSVSSSEFAGGDRSYPIPTRADAIDALRLAGLHGRQDVKSKVYAKYPDLKKEFGGEGTGAKFPGETQNDIIECKKKDFLKFIAGNTISAIAKEESNHMRSLMDKTMAQDGMEVEGSEENDVFWNNQMGTGYNTSPPANQPFSWNFQGSTSPQFSTPESIGMQTNNIMMQDTVSQQNPASNNNLQQQNGSGRQYYTRSMEPEANWGIAALSKAASIFELRDAKERERKFKELQGADNQFRATPGTDRGDYDQFGNFRPDKKVPVQFTGYNTAAQSGTPYTFQQGGEYYMTDDQVNSFREAGGDIEFLD